MRQSGTKPYSAGVAMCLVMFAVVFIVPAHAGNGAPAGGRPSAVGLDAQGVDPLCALYNSGGLDVRDAFNRSVSAGLVERQIKAGMSSAAEAVAGVSGLPHAVEVLRALESLTLFADALTRGKTASRPRPDGLLPRPQREPQAWAYAQATGFFLDFSGGIFPVSTVFRVSHPPVFQLPLRC